MSSETKIVYYLVPVYPFMALTIACAIGILYKSIPRFSIVFSICILLILFYAFSATQAFASRTGSFFKYDKLITAEEKEAGLIVHEHPEVPHLYVYKYKYWETIHFYSDKKIENLLVDQEIPKRFFLIIATPLLKQLEFPPEIQKYLTPVFTGIALTLFEFNESP